jgi:hypothetical protein
LIGSGGRVVSGVAIAVALRDLPELGQLQLVQTTRDQVRLRVPGGARKEAIDRARQRLGRLLGDGVGIRVDFVDEIARTASGKFQFTRCEVEPRADVVESRQG